MADSLKCPICGNPFKSDACPHSVSDAQRHQQQQKDDDRIRKIVIEELRKRGL
jgi:hypothetical protein